MAPVRQFGKPRLFISHGQWDTVLPIARCSRRIVPQLQGAGYDVQYREFNGLHTVPGVIAVVLQSSGLPGSGKASCL